MQITEELPLVSHAGKILLRIILERILVKTETKIADEQAGFRQVRETKRPNHESQNTDAKGTREHQQPIIYVLCEHEGIWFDLPR